LGIAVGLAPLVLAAFGYELGPKEGLVLAILTALCIAGAMVLFFLPWVEKFSFWLVSQIRRIRWPFALAQTVKRLEAENKQLREEKNSFLKQLVEVQPGGASAEGILTVEHANPSATIERLQGENEQQKARIDSLEKELEQARSADKMGTPTVEREDSLEVIKRLTAERDALKSQPGDEELKQRSLKLSEKLFQFLDDRAENDPQSTKWLVGASDAELNELSQRSIQYMKETMNLYDQQYAGQVMALFEALEHRGWWNLEELDPEERKRIKNPGTPYDIRDIARRLSAIGHRI
jgi:hypothetical protein